MSKNSKPWKCSACGKRSPTPGGIEEHISVVHPKDQEARAINTRRNRPASEPDRSVASMMINAEIERIDRAARKRAGVGS